MNSMARLAAALALCLLVAWPVRVQAQSTRPDSTRAVRGAVKSATSAKPDTVKGELVLDDIFIQGKVEKPGVIIVPKRVEPELKEKELDRSFKKELREGEIMKPKEELRRVDQVESIKKAVERKRK